MRWVAVVVTFRPKASICRVCRHQIWKKGETIRWSIILSRLSPAYHSPRTQSFCDALESHRGLPFSGWGQCRPKVVVYGSIHTQSQPGFMKLEQMTI